MWIWSLRPSRAFAIAVASGLGACQGIETAEPPEPAVSSLSAAVNVDDKCDWEQWGGNPAHTGQGCKEVDHMDRISAHMTFDPFLEQELADAVIQKGNGALFTHFQSPLLVDDHVYMEFKAGTKAQTRIV